MLLCKMKIEGIFFSDYMIYYDKNHRETLCKSQNVIIYSSSLLILIKDASHTHHISRKFELLHLESRL